MADRPPWATSVLRDGEVEYLGDFVFARKMATAYFGDAADPVLLFVDGFWIEGVWEGGVFKLVDGRWAEKDVPAAWCPLPKTPEDWS